MKHGLQVFTLRMGLALATGAALAGATAQGQGTGASAFSGSWYVNPARLQVNGPTFSFTTDADGFAIRYSDGIGPKVVCDGQPKPTRPGYTRVCTRSTAGYSVSTMHGDRTAAQVAWTLSDDGKTLHERRVYANDDDSTDTREITAARNGTGTGFSGEWKVVGYTDTAFAKPFVLTGDATTLSVQRPGSGKTETYRLDGTELAMSNTVKGSMRMDGGQTVHERVTRNGKLFSDRLLTLSADGRSITEVETHPDAPGDRTTTVYEKR